jgi:hypothetical protein
MSHVEAADPDRPSRSRRGYWLPAFIALAALLLIGGAVGAGDMSHSAPKTLYGPDVASEIALGIEVQQGITVPPAVSCPRREPVKIGWSFSCKTMLSGRSETVAVVEVDGRGHLRWQLTPTDSPATT